jgi:hypothetical protein
LKDLFLAMAITALQSQCMDIKCFGFNPNGISIKKFLNQSASFPADFKAINSDYIVNRAINVTWSNMILNI